MEQTGKGWQIGEGVDVVGSDGEKVGKVIGQTGSYIVVEKGFFFPTDYYIPASAITGAESERVTLNVTKDAALVQGWDVIPGDDTVGTPGGAFITGATGYDEQIGFDADGDPVTDADARLGGEYVTDEAIPQETDETDTEQTTPEPAR